MDDPTINDSDALCVHDLDKLNHTVCGFNRQKVQPESSHLSANIAQISLVIFPSIRAPLTNACKLGGELDRQTNFLQPLEGSTMRKLFLKASVIIANLVMTNIALASDAVHWTYAGPEGPQHWAELSPDFVACGAGKNQSPIDLAGMIEGELPNLDVKYQAGGKEVINNGHTVQVNYTAGSAMVVANRTFELKQFHFHAPSENTIEGRAFPMEAHFVHSDKDGNLAVISVMFNEGKHNVELEKAWAQMPMESGKSATLKQPVNANTLLPKERDYYRFNGSLTTPPCSEGVNWFVMKHFDTASKEQIAKFAKAVHHANNRPVQPVNARVVVQ
jgi:carbonic anhydrase